MRSATQSLAIGLGHLKTAAHNHHIDILAWTLQKQVTHISSHYITLQSQTVGSLRKQPEFLTVKQLGQFLVAVYLHNIYGKDTQKRNFIFMFALITL